MSPNRSRDELLGEVVRRGEWLRRRRRAVAGLGGGIALLLAVAGVAAVVGTGGDPVTQLAAGGPTSTVAQTLQASGAGGTVVAVDAPSTTAASQAATATTAPPRAVATTVPPPAATNPDPVITAPTTPEPTVAQPRQPRCSPDQLEAVLTLSQPSYRPGEQVAGQAVLRNRSGAPCYYYSYTQSQEIVNSAGTAVSPGGALIADAFADTAFAPAQTLNGSVSWDLMVCIPGPACSPAPPGTYTATVTWSFDGPPIRGTAAFQVVP